MKSKSFRLFAVLPGFLLGMASAVDMGATLSIYNIDKTPEEADSKAFEADWHATGNDFYHAIEQFKTQNEF